MDRDTISAFDTIYSNQQTQLLKLSLPLIPEDYRFVLAIYIKFLELQYTLKKAHDIRFHTSDIPGGFDSLNAASMEQYFKSIQPYLSDGDKIKFEKIRNMFQTMEQLKQLKPILDLMMQTENMQSENVQTDILKSFLSEEQMMMFEMFNNSSL